MQPEIAISSARLGKMDDCKRHLDLYHAELPEFYDEMLLFESHENYALMMMTENISARDTV